MREQKACTDSRFRCAGTNTVSAINGANIAGSTVLASGGSWTLAIAAMNSTVTVNSSQLQTSAAINHSDKLGDITAMSGDIVQVDTSVFGPLSDYNLHGSVSSWFIGVTSGSSNLGNGANTIGMDYMDAGQNNQSVTSGSGADVVSLNVNGAYKGAINLGGGTNTLHTSYNADVSTATLSNIQNVTIGGAHTLTVNENDFTATTFLSVIGDGSASLTVMKDTSLTPVTSLDLTHTNMSGLSTIDVSNLGTQTVLFNSTSIDTTDALTWVGDAANKTNMEFTAGPYTYNASNWTLTNQEFGNVTLDTNVHLIASQNFLSSSNTSVTFIVGSWDQSTSNPVTDSTGLLTLNGISNYVATSGTAIFGHAELNTAGSGSFIDIRAAYTVAATGDAIGTAITNGWNITGGNGNETIYGSSNDDTISINGSGNKFVEGYHGADVISTAGFTHSGSDIFYQHLDDGVQQTGSFLGGNGGSRGKVVAGNYLDFTYGVDIINGFKAGVSGDKVGIDNYSANQNASSIVGTTTGNNTLFSTGSVYKLEGNWDATAMRFTVTADGGGTNADGHTYATAIIEGTNSTNLLSTTSIVLLVGVHDTAIVSDNFGAIPGGA